MAAGKITGVWREHSIKGGAPELPGDVFFHDDLVVFDAQQIVAAFLLHDKPGIFGIGVEGVGAHGACGARGDGQRLTGRDTSRITWIAVAALLRRLLLSVS